MLYQKSLIKELRTSDGYKVFTLRKRPSYIGIILGIQERTDIYYSRDGKVWFDINKMPCSEFANHIIRKRVQELEGG